MALSRAYLKGMGLTDEQVNGIIEAHTETVDGLKAEIEKYKADAVKLPKVQEELEKAKAAAKDSGEYDKLKKEFEDYKAEVAGKEALAAKKAALKKLAEAKDGAYLTDTGVAKALKYSNFDEIELDEKGEIKGAKELVKNLREEWKEHVQTEKKTGVDTPDPPAGGNNNGGANTRASQLYKEHYTALYGQKGETK